MADADMAKLYYNFYVIVANVFQKSIILIYKCTTLSLDFSILSFEIHIFW